MSQTQKYHYSPKIRKIMPCSAKEKICQYKTHYEINTNQKVNLKIPEGLTKPPIILEPLPYNEPRLVTTLTTADPKTAILTILGQPKNQTLPLELQKLIAENQWDKPETWTKNRNQTVTPPTSLYTTIQTWFWEQPNASDKQGILEYVRDKGTNTTNLTPLEAIKKQYIEENLLLIQMTTSTNFLNKILQTTKVQTKTVDLKTITASQTRIEDVEARTPHNYKNEPGIAGILLKTNGKYQLLDGYHRLKHLRQQNETQATYIVLS